MIYTCNSDVDLCIAQDPHFELDFFYSARLLKQQSTTIYLVHFGNNILIAR